MKRNDKRRFNPAPGWPEPPSGDWLPPVGWTPDPTWPPAPPGWQIVVDEVPVAPTVAMDPDTLWQGEGLTISGFGGGRYRLTRRFLFFERGLLRTDAQQLPVASVTDVDVRQSMVQKARGVGSVVVMTSGRERVEIENIADFRNLRDILNDVVHDARLLQQARAQTTRHEVQSRTRIFSDHQKPEPMAYDIGQAVPAGAPAVAPAPGQPALPPATGQPALPPAPDYIAQLRQLGELRDAGVLTEEEFNSKKAEILSRL